MDLTFTVLLKFKVINKITWNLNFECQGISLFLILKSSELAQSHRYATGCPRKKSSLNEDDIIIIILK